MISFFDNGGTPPVHSQSRVIVVALDRQTMTVTLVSSFVHPTPLLAGSQGDFQPLAGGDWFVGWGQEPFFSEVRPRRQGSARRPPARRLPVLHGVQARLGGSTRELPTLAVGPGKTHGALEVYASWNWATQVAAWRVLEGATATSFAPVAQGSRTGFETAISSSLAQARMSPCRRSV